jgi:hypothetical protein
MHRRFRIECDENTAKSSRSTVIQQEHNDVQLNYSNAYKGHKYVTAAIIREGGIGILESLDDK